MAQALPCGVEIEIGNGQAAAADALHIAGVIDHAQLVERLGDYLADARVHAAGAEARDGALENSGGPGIYFFHHFILMPPYLPQRPRAASMMALRSSTSPPEDRAVTIFVLPRTAFSTSTANWAGMAISALTIPRRAL